MTLSEPLALGGGATHRLSFKISANSDLIDKTLQVESVTIQIGKVHFVFDRAGQKETANLVQMTSNLSMGQLHVAPGKEIKFP